MIEKHEDTNQIRLVKFKTLNLTDNVTRYMISKALVTVASIFSFNNITFDQKSINEYFNPRDFHETNNALITILI